LLVTGVLAWGAVLLFLPHAVGEAGLRANWDEARALLPALLVSLVGYASSFGAVIGLRSLAAAKRSLRARFIDGVFTGGFGLSGACLDGARGVAWGYAATGCLRSMNAWWQFSRAVGEHERCHDVMGARFEARG